MPFQFILGFEICVQRSLIALPVCFRPFEKVESGCGANTIRKWEVTGPNGPVAELLRILAMASDRYPILEMFNVFDRHDVPEKDRPARRQAFREQMRGDVRRRIG